jgi:hypothetical protein
MQIPEQSTEFFRLQENKRGGRVDFFLNDVWVSVGAFLVPFWTIIDLSASSPIVVNHQISGAKYA